MVHRRQRDYKPPEPLYAAQLDTLSVEPSKLGVQLLNVQTHGRLLLELTALQDKTVRVRVTEVDGLRPRYEPPVGDVLVSEPHTDK